MEGSESSSVFFDGPNGYSPLHLVGGGAVPFNGNGPGGSDETGWRSGLVTASRAEGPPETERYRSRCKPSFVRRAWSCSTAHKGGGDDLPLLASCTARTPRTAALASLPLARRHVDPEHIRCDWPGSATGPTNPAPQRPRLPEWARLPEGARKPLRGPETTQGPDPLSRIRPLTWSYGCRGGGI
ncbi:hypothetical protein E6P78_22695 [Streptomyces sp. A0958]|nr:hypothetical protein E6P78_22695 [Streptomyces sp. A0958]